MAKTKTEIKNEIYALEKKALNLFKKGDKGPKINKMLEKVIRMEDKYYKKFGQHPSKQYGAIIDGRKPIKRKREKQSLVWE